MKVGFISLGCSKNLVDTEKTIAMFVKHGYEIVNNPENADIIIINTCGFIESAKEEAISTILEMAEYKKENCKYLIVMGCLAERYKEELAKEMPEVNLFIKYSEYDSFWKQIEECIGNCNYRVDKSEEKAVKEISCNDLIEFEDRVITTGDNFAYLKIADGCSNHCTYCAIPYIRGPQISRKIEDILNEAERLVEEGYKEIILIAQDTTKYGTDIYGEPKLAELLTKLCGIEGIEWIRFLYAYPETIDDELIKVVKENDKICKYFDIPIQHISDSVLKRMNRKTTGAKIETLIKKIKESIPDVILRTSLIVGFPGETEEDFEKLYNFVEKGYFDKLGVFKYSKEEGTPAARLKEQIHHSTKNKRYNQIMKIAKEISAKKLRKFIGKEYQVLIENKTFDQKFYIARSYMDIPDTDGVVIIENSKDNMIGKFAKCRIKDVKDYDLIGELI